MLAMKTNHSKFKIESTIPIPDQSNGGRRSQYPFRAMKIGESFLVAAGDSSVVKVRSAASYFQIRNLQFKFIVRTTPEGVRVWRVKK